MKQAKNTISLNSKQNKIVYEKFQSVDFLKHECLKNPKFKKILLNSIKKLSFENEQEKEEFINNEQNCYNSYLKKYDIKQTNEIDILNVIYNL